MLPPSLSCTQHSAKQRLREGTKGKPEQEQVEGEAWSKMLLGQPLPAPDWEGGVHGGRGEE